MLRLASSRWISAVLLFVIIAVTPGAEVLASALTPVPRPSSDTPALEAGGTAVVRADGDCLRVREAPSLSARQLVCLPEGSSVRVLEGSQVADGYSWRQIEARGTTGWAAETFLEAVTTSATPAPTAAPTPVTVPGAFENGSTAVIRANGDCLNLRETPGLTGRELTCLPDGTLVTVLAGSKLVDGYNWQQVEAGASTGWVAEMYLQPPGSTAPAAAPDSCPTSAPPPPQEVADVTSGFTIAPPAGGGVGLTIWDGGLTSEMAAVAESAGCQLSSVWTTRPDGTFIAYIFGAPDLVNEAWLADYPGGEVPAGVPVITVCAGARAAALSIHPITLQTTAGAPVQKPGAAAPPWVSALSAVVIDGATGAVLFDKDAHVARPPASLTKIFTAILAIEGNNLDAWAKVDVDSRQMPGSSLMGLLPGDCFRLRDLVYGLMLPSGNDAALAIARYTAGSDAAFVEQMNALVARLGLVDSSFANPHGLDEWGHVASAYDLAMASRYGMSLPAFADIVGAVQWTARGSRTINLPNVNGFLTSYPGADGVKTGYTGGAGTSLVASATRDGHRIYAVLLNAPNRYGDAQALMDWAFSSFTFN